MLEFLKGLLESGEHAIQVVGVGGTTATAINHDTLLQALIEFAKAEAERYVPAPVVEQVASAVNVGIAGAEQVTAYLKQQDAATGAPQGTFQASA